MTTTFWRADSGEAQNFPGIRTMETQYTMKSLDKMEKIQAEYRWYNFNVPEMDGEE